MKPKSISSRQQAPLLNFLVLCLGIAGAAGTLFLDSAQAASATWTGLAGDNVLNTGTNWTGDVAPAGNDDIATWDGPPAANLALTWTGNIGGYPDTLGTSLVITGNQTGSLLIGSDAANLGSGTTNIFALGNLSIASGAGAFTFGDGVDLDNLVFRNPGGVTTNTLTNDSANTATFASNVKFNSGGAVARSLVFAGSGNWQLDAPLTLAGLGSFAITKSGSGTLTLAAANGYTGTTTIRQGILNLGGGTATGSLGFGSNSLVMAGGTLAYTTTGNPTQTFAGTSISSRASELSVVTGNTLNLGAITRSAGATVNFDNTGGGTFQGSATLANDILRWATVRSSGTAAANTPDGFTFATVTGGAVVPYTAATSSIFSWSGSGAATVNYDVTGAAGSLGAARTANSVRFVGAADTIQQYYSTTLTLNALLNASANSLTLQPDGSSTPTFVIGDSNELVLAAAAGPITIAMPVVNGASAGSLTKTGASTVTLSAANTYTGTTRVNQGTLSLGSASLADAATVSIASGATLHLPHGATDVVGTLVLGGNTYTSGIFDVSTPGSFISGSGKIQVGIVAGFAGWIDTNYPALPDKTEGGDPDNDGITNLMEYVLNGNPGASSTGILPAANNSDPTDLIFTFTRREESAGDTTQVFQYGTNLTGWTPINITGTPGAGVTLGTPALGLQLITVKVPKSAAASGKLFGRLQVTKP